MVAFPLGSSNQHNNVGPRSLNNPLKGRIVIGGIKTRLGGNIALVNLFPYAMRLDDVRAYVSNTMGTDGKPYLSSDLPQIPDFSWGAFINLFACPGGNCDNMKKASPMDVWNSEYA